MLLSRILSRASRTASRTASLLSSPPQALHPPLVSDQCRALAYGSPGKVVAPNQFTFHATPFWQCGISSSASPEHTDGVSNSEATKASGNAENSTQSGDRSAEESNVSRKTTTGCVFCDRWLDSLVKEEGYKGKTRYVKDDEDSVEDFYQSIDSFLKEEGYKEKECDVKGGFMIYERVPRPGEVDATKSVENDATEANTAEKGS